MLTVLGGLAEFERTLIKARSGEGREAAKGRGVRFGQRCIGSERRRASDGVGSACFGGGASGLGLEGIVSNRLTAPYRSGRRGTGSRSRTRIARQCGGRV